MAKKPTKPVARAGKRKKTTPKAQPEEEDQMVDIFDGPMARRRFGLRVDDDVIVYIVGGDILREVKGRVLEHKKGLHLVDEDGFYHRVSYDWVTDIIVVRHNRPNPTEDPEFKRRPVPQPKTKGAKAQQAVTADHAYQ